MAKSFYPNLSSIVKVDDMPEQLQFIEDGIQQALDKIYYKDLQVVKSPDGSNAFFDLTLVTNEAIKINLTDGGLAIIVNPGGAGETFIPLRLSYNWPILSLIQGFRLEDFADVPDRFKELLDEAINLSDVEMIQIAVETFEGDQSLGSFEAFVNKINAEYLLTSTPNELTYPAAGQELRMAQHIENEINNSLPISDSIRQVISEVYILSSDLAQFKNNLDLMSSAVSGSTIDEFIKDLITPQLDASLDLSIGLSFPRNILTPLDGVAGAPLPEPEQSILIFSAGTLNFSTVSGAGFDEEMSVSLNHPSQIGNTGLGLDITEVKLDLSRTQNILEADLDGRPKDFVGVYVKRIGISLPEKWFKNQTPGTTAEIFGNNLLMGTGGLSGTLGLEAVGGNDILWANIGNNDGFKVGFERFDITFKQNKVQSSNIKGAMEIAKFVYPQSSPYAGQPVNIGIEGHINDDGDFNLTASATPPYPIEFPNVFTYHLASVELGKEDDDWYIGTSGEIEFMGFLKDTLKLESIEIEKLRIYSDGTIEFEGGSINLIEPIVLPLGPVEITVSAIHYGSHQREINGVMRKFNYFGFDGGVSVDPLGVEIRGDGVKYYYCTDDLPNTPDPYLHIQTLYLDLTIPASTPAVIFNGWLSIPEPGVSEEYAGGIKLQIPKAKISGSADMKLQPKYPAFIIDVSVDLPSPIPIGPVGIYGFRGLIGYRYVAEKEAVGLVSGVDSWYDYYKFPPRGVHVTKFNGPDRTTQAGTPFSLGIGASLGTSFDNGTVVNIRAMILLSIPSLFMIDGKAAILSARLGLEDSGEPPFFAFIALGDNSLEFGIGADFKMPTSSGDIMTLYADIQAGFFFNNSSKWYVNVGTKTNPVTARVVKLVTLTSYLMLSAKGIEAGARGEFDFKREYGPIKVHAWAYIEVGGKISFEKPQFGAYLAAGVGADIDIKIVSLYAAFDILFGVEAPKPFLIYGEFHYCVKITIAWVFKFKFCGDLSVMWEFNQNVDRTPIDPLINPSNADKIENLVKGVNMLSNETFELAYLPGGIPASPTADIQQAIIPLDTYVDIKTEKGFIPNAIGSLIGGINNPPERYTEMVPPQKIIKGKEVRQVKHQYSIESLSVKSWNPTSNSWDDYHPYKALYPSDPALDALKIGHFQKQGAQYNTVRLLATNPFSYTEQGEPGWFVPEQNGITPATLFCEGNALVPECANFLAKPLGTKYYCYNENQLFYSNQAAFLLLDRADGDYAEVVSEVNPFNFDQSVSFQNSNRMQIRLPEPSVEVTLKLSTYSQSVSIKYYASLIDDTTLEVQYGNPDASAPNPNEPYEVIVSGMDLNSPINYVHPEWMAVTRIEIKPLFPNQEQIDDLLEQIAVIENTNNQIALGLIEGEQQSTQALEDQLADLQTTGCTLASPDAGFFVNSYTSKEKALAFHHAEEFTEANGTYIYAVGNDEAWPVIVKTNLDGSIVWEQIISMSLQQQNVVFNKIVQLNGENGLRYVVSGDNGTNEVLVCVDETGAVQWIHEVRLSEPSVENQLITSYDKNFVFFIYSNRAHFNGIPTPTVLKIDSNGNLVTQKSLVVPNFSNNGIFIKTARNYSEGIAFAGYVADNVSGTIIFDLDDNLNEKGIRHIQEPSVNVHDMLVNSFDDYLISAYDNTANAVVVSRITGAGTHQYATIPNSADANSLLAFAPTGFYVFIDYTGQGYVHKMNAVLDIDWSKEFIYLDDRIGIRSVAYSALSQHLVITTESNDYLVRSGNDLELCITVPRVFDQPQKSSMEVEPVSVEIVAAKLSLIDLNGSPSGIRTTIATLCSGQGDNNDKCYTLLHEVCWLSLENYQYNILIPGQAAITADTQATVDGISGYIQPIWRPDTSYVVSFSLKDVVDDGASSPGTYNYTYGFTTGGPVGYFHTHPNSDYVDPLNPQLELYPLTSLTRYIDYQRSYPNADGNLLSSKPLFFDDETTQIDLFFSKAYARHFFHNWQDYNGWDSTNGRIKIVIKDPREDSSIVNPPYLDYDPADTIYTNIPQTVESWQDDENPLIPFVFQQYANLIDSNECIPIGGDTIVPPSQSLEVKLKRLKPLKMYTAIVNNLYDLDNDNVFNTTDETKEVHRFTFQTSRYPNFKSQVNSYLMKRPNILTVNHKAEGLIAAYSLANIQAGYDTIVGTANPIGDALIPTYPNPYDRIVEGIWGLTPFTLPAEKPEFKFIRDSNNGDEVIGVIVLSPTPMNSNKIPFTEAIAMLHGLDYDETLNADYKITANADYTQAIVMHSSLAFVGTLLSFKFQHPTTGEAVFHIQKSLSAAEVTAAYDTIMNNANPDTDDLEINYQHKFDRIFEGIWGFNPLEKAETTEFNVIRDANEDVRAIIIRNPEPFNNPRIPLDTIQDTIQIVDGTGTPISGYQYLFSKDYSQVLVMHDSLVINPTQFNFKFTYKVWDGNDYIIPGTTTGYTSDEIGTIVINNLDTQNS